MSETEGEPEVLDDEPEPVLPEILVFGMTGDLLGATINMQTDPAGPNIGDQRQTQLVMARSPDELHSRVVSTLIAQFGMSQEDAQVAVDNMTALAPAAGVAGDALPTTGGTMTGALILAGDPAQDLEASTKQYGDAAITQVNTALDDVNAALLPLRSAAPVTGSRALPEEALANLLSALAYAGVIADQTTI